MKLIKKNISIKKNIKNNLSKKWVKETWVNLLSIILGSWDRDSLIKRKPKQIIKFNSESNTILNDEIGGGEVNWKKKWVNEVNSSNTCPGWWDGDDPIKSKFNVENLWFRSGDWDNFLEKNKKKTWFN